MAELQLNMAETDRLTARIEKLKGKVSEREEDDCDGGKKYKSDTTGKRTAEKAKTVTDTEQERRNSSPSKITALEVLSPGKPGKGKRVDNVKEEKTPLGSPPTTILE